MKFDRDSMVALSLPTTWIHTETGTMHRNRSIPDAGVIPELKGLHEHRITDSRCVLAVRDLAASTRYYMDVLGFTRDFGDSSDGWSFLSRDGFKLMLGHCADAMPAGELGDHSWFVYLIVHDVDGFYKEITSRGADATSTPTSKPWGLREFGIRTPEGHRIVFGEPINTE